jgi:Zn-dependent protease with chaperone function
MPDRDARGGRAHSASRHPTSRPPTGRHPDFWADVPQWGGAQVGSRHLETSAITAIAPVLALVPVWLLALAVFWAPLRLVWDVPFWLFAALDLAAGALLFLRPVQAVLLTRLLGARRPTAHERTLLQPVWTEVAQVNRFAPRRYVLAVLPADELNAYACGGHLVVVTSWAVECLPPAELAGVLAHELSHHLGLHTVALTIGHWLSVPILVLARVGFFLQNVATAATGSFASHSAALTFVGRLVALVLRAVSWIFLAALIASTAIGNVVGRRSEFQADRRVVSMGYGRELAAALRRVIAAGGGERPLSWRERLFATHPSARTRVARIEAFVRSRGRRTV